MKIPTVNSCCCGVNLRMATLIIGIFAFLGSIGAFLNTRDWFAEVEEVKDHSESDDPYVIRIRENLRTIQFFIYVDLLLSTTSTVLSLVLLMGYYNKNRSMMRSWVLGTIGIQLLSLVFNTFLSFLFGELFYLAFNLNVFLNLYFAIVVNSYAQEVIKPVAGIE